MQYMTWQTLLLFAMAFAICHVLTESVVMADDK